KPTRANRYSRSAISDSRTAEDIWMRGARQRELISRILLMSLRRAFMWRLPSLVDQVGEHHGNAVQGRQDHDRYDDAATDEVLRRCVAVLTHGGAVIEQQYQE